MAVRSSRSLSSSAVLPRSRESASAAPARQECRSHGRSQTTAAPAERVSDSLTNEGGAVMPRGFGLSVVTKDAIWKLRAQGLSDREIGRRLGLPRGSVSNHLARTGGIRPRARRRPERCLSFEEREEVSRAIAGGQSARAIARALGRSHTTIAREINRCGGRRRYRAQAAEREAWRRSRRPRPTKLELCPELRRVVRSASKRTTPPSRSRAGCGSATPTMRRCRSPTRRSTGRSTSRRGGRFGGS